MFYKKKSYSDKFICNVTKYINETLLPVVQGWNGTFTADFYERADGSVKLLELNNFWESDPCLYGCVANIGNPPVIEEDIYNVLEARGLKK